MQLSHQALGRQDVGARALEPRLEQTSSKESVEVLDLNNLPHGRNVVVGRDGAVALQDLFACAVEQGRLTLRLVLCTETTMQDARCTKTRLSWSPSDEGRPGT